VNSFLTKPVRPETVERAVADAVDSYLLSLRNQELVRELEERNRELHEAQQLLTMSLDERTRQLLDANRHLESLALRDSLTGLYNHRFFQERLSEEIARSKRYGGRLALVLADIDRFRAFNEANGHPEGDKLLVTLARLLTGSTRANDVVARIRPTDMVARFGGEEFVVIVPGTNKEGASRMCERIQQTIRGLDLPGREAVPGGRITLSYGIAECPADADTSAKLLDCAETALVRAKQLGRDRVELF
jgi:diguanylate cyclase (GGDEF)-like protein